MFSRRSPRQPDLVLAHWFALVDRQQFSALEFYRSIENELTARRVPQLQANRIEYHEGGVLSDKRTYLRLARERFAFDVCAAPFGTGYFFSLRFVEMPRGGCLAFLALLMALSLIAAAASLAAWYATFSATREFWWMVGACLVAMVGLSAAFQSPAKEPAFVGAPAPRRGKPDFDGFVLGLPVIGEWYERLRRDTYFRNDTRLMYLVLISEIVKGRIGELTAAGGMTLVRAYEYCPILGDLYKPSTIEPRKHKPDTESGPTDAIT